jgi:hypothetical protein
MRGLLVTVFEALGRDARPKFNAHVIVIMPDADARDRLIESVHRSSVYAGHVDARPVANWKGLTGYMLKEATPTAWFAAGKRFRRIRGSIPLGDLGGDRVVLSRDLRDALIATGRIARFKRTYAKRQRSPSAQAVAHRRARSPMADHPRLEPTPTSPAGAHHAVQGPAAEPAARAQLSVDEFLILQRQQSRTDKLRAVDKRALRPRSSAWRLVGEASAMTFRSLASTERRTT